MAEAKTKVFPLVNKGVIQKIDPGLIEDGQFARLQNVSSIQEGSISSRFGSRKYNNASGVGVIHSMAKLAFGSVDTSNPRYAGDGTELRRVSGPYTTFTDVSSGLGLNTSRWEAFPFDASGSGHPRLYIAHPTRMMQDDGTYSTLRPWGILPPVRPVTISPGDPSLTNFPGLEVLTDQSGGAGRLSATVASSSLITTGYYQVLPTSMAGILPGMHLVVGSSNVIVDRVDANFFYAFFGGSPPSGSIQSFSNDVNLDPGNTPIDPLPADGRSYHVSFTDSIDWSFLGTADSGYVTDDLVHVGLYIGNAAFISEIRFRIFVGASSTDYYEKAITPSQILAFTEGNSTALTTGTARATLVSQGLLGQTEFPDKTLAALQPVEIPPTISGEWFEFDIPKSEFLANGNAGSSFASWKNVTSATVLVITNDISGLPTFTVSVGAIYARGGQGPDSLSNPAAAQYNWIYTFRDPVTGAEGNPSEAMVPELQIDIQKRAVQVTCYGQNTNATTGNPSITGYGSIAVYRSGGVFADALYRFVGYAANPGISGGVPNAVVFIDNSQDSDIEGNQTVDFDNDPPVTSTPQVPFSGNILTITSGAGSYATITVNNYANPIPTDLTGFFSVGATVHIGQGTNAEDCIVQGVSGGSIVVYIQRDHFVGELVTCEEIFGQACDIVCAAGSSLLLAGDPNNPHVVYQSKPGRPHAWPVVNQTTGVSYNLHVSDPSNPVNGLAEFGGEYIALCLKGLWVFNVWQGQMILAGKSSADHGLIAKHLWWKVGNQLWYLSEDGIYAWAGGGDQKMSEAIDWVFRKQTVGGFAPLDYSITNEISGAFYQGYFHFSYVDTNGNNQGFRYSLSEKRWEPTTFNSGSATRALTCFLHEEDTNRLIAGVFVNADSHSYIYQLEVGTSDGWNSAGTDGGVIDYFAATGFMSPEGRLNQIQLQDVVVEILNPTEAVTIKLFYDFASSPDATDTFTIPTNATRTRVPLPLQQASSSTNGKECNSFQVQMSGSTTGGATLYSIGCRYTPLAQIQRGMAYDWSDVGHPFDKRFYECTIEFDSKGQSVLVHLDIISGIDGNTLNQNVQGFTLPPVSGRAKKTFAIVDGIIAKLVRLRPNVTGSDFEIFSVNWVKEDYPADIVNFTSNTDTGYAYDKYFQQVVLDVNTNGQVVPITIEIDGVAGGGINVQSTLSTRNQIKTLTPALLGKKARIVVGVVPFGGMFQLFDHKFIAQPADKGPVGHSFDWDDLGYEHDKRLKWCVIEYDTVAAGSITVQVDTLTGIGGKTQNITAFTFSLNGTGRSKQQFPIADGVIVKMVRLHPQSDNVVFKQWKYTFEFEQYPADTVLWTPFNDFGYEHLKIIQEIAFDVDTGGVAASVNVIADNGTLQTISVNTTESTREFIYTLNPSLTGKKFKLIVTPGGGGKFQLWDWKPKFIKGDPGPVEHSFDWDDLGYEHDKRLKWCVIEYDTMAAGSIVVQVDTLTGIGGKQQNLAAFTFSLNGAGRSKQQFPIPDGVIVKMVRIHPQSDNSVFKQWKYTFEFEQYPADTVLWTPFNDFGYEHLKIVQEIAFDVDTGGVAASVAVIADNGTVQTVSITTSEATREFIYTLNPSLVGKKFKLLITPGFGGKFQLWNWKPKFLKGDPGPVEHSFDWDDLGSPNDKRLLVVHFEYDTGGTPVTMQMDTITGVMGTVISLSVATFTLSGSGRSKQPFTLPVDTIAKMIRIYPNSSTFGGFRVWKYVFEKMDLPPDAVPATEWTDNGWACDKVLRGVTIDIDTGGVACSLALQLDGATVQTFSITTSVTDRVRILTCNSDEIGKLFRIIPTPGAGGKAQIYKVTYDAWQEPCARTRLDTYEIVLGHASWKYLKQVWLEYTCNAVLQLFIMRENNILFSAFNFPAHAHRDIERLLLPDLDPATGKLNKSRAYRFLLLSTQPFKLYRDGSRFEIMQLNGDQRAAFEQHYLSEFTQPQV